MPRKAAKQPVVPSVSEKTEERWADRAADMMGFTVIRFSQPRRTMQARGWVDRLYVHRGRGVAVFAELKAEKGKLSAHQVEMHATLRDAGLSVVCGTANTVGQFLVEQLKQRTIAEAR